MKKLLFLFILLLPIIALSQDEKKLDAIDSNYDQIYGEPAEKVRQFSYEEIFMNTAVSESETELQFMRYCNFRYHKQRQTAYILTFTGMAATAGGLFLPMDEPDFPVVLSAAGGACSLAGLIVLVSADRWLKYSSIKPSDTGVGVKIIF